MKYFLDTEFIEGKQDKTFLGVKYGETKPTIDLISIGIVSEEDVQLKEDINHAKEVADKCAIDNPKCSNDHNRLANNLSKLPTQKEYYAISKDFNLKAAWKNEWVRENVLKPIWYERVGLDKEDVNGKPIIPTFKQVQHIINKYGKTNKQIAQEIKEFIYESEGCGWIVKSDADKGFMINNLKLDKIQPEFYAYFADYDWVVFCQLFGTMMDLPKGFPMFAFDIQQQIEEYKIDKEQLLKEIPQVNCHNALQDSIWNYNAYKWIQNQINNGK